MPTDKKRVVVTVDDELWSAIEQYRHDQHIMAMSQAAVMLIEVGLKAKKTPVNRPEPRRLDEIAIRRHIKALNDLIEPKKESE